MNGNFTAAQKELLTLLSSMQPICNKRTTLDITEAVLFHVTPRELTIKSTDLEVSLQASIAIECDLVESIDFLISGKRIFELVKELDSTIDFKISDTQLHLHAGGADLALNIKESKEFPPFPERIENLMNVDAKFLLNMLDCVAFLIPQNNSNVALNGMLFEIGAQSTSMVATDGYSLARVTTSKYTLAEEKKWLIPKRAVLELKKLLEAYPSDNIFIGVCGNQLVFSGKNFNFFTKLIVEPFPQYKAILAKDDFMPATLSKEPFVKTLKRTGCLLAGKFVSTQFVFGEGKLKVSLQNKDVGMLEEELKLNEFDGGHIESRFYSPYLLNCIQAVPDDTVKFFIKNSVKPIIFEAGGEECRVTYLVMPVSMNQNEQS